MKQAASLAELPPEQAVHAMVRGLHRRWRLCVLLPLVYLAVGVAIQARWNGVGFLPMDASIFVVLIFLGGFALVMLWRLLAVMERRHLAELAALRQDPAAFYERARAQLLLRFGVCDVAASPGILLFLAQGDPVPLLLFCMASMAFYLRAMPSEYRLGAAFLRPDLLK